MAISTRALVLASLLALTGCGNTSNPIANTSTPLPSLSIVEQPSKVSDADSGVDCTELGFDGYAKIIQQAALTIDDQDFQIATVACTNDAGEDSAEVVESFIQDAGVWASNGLASGLDVEFSTTGPCESTANELKCPAVVFSEDGAEVPGVVLITGESGQPVWTFDPVS